jgi:hypothetical protein
MNDEILNFIRHIETGNLIDAEAAFTTLLHTKVEEELDETKAAVAQSMFGESVDLAELNKTTLKSYIDKVNAKARGMGGSIPAKKLWKRTKGVDAATKRMAKESTDLGEACWKGYVKKGMKMKSGKLVPNCVEK